MSLIKDVLNHLAGVNQNVQRVPARRQQSTLLMNNLCSQQPSSSAALKISTFVYMPLEWNCRWHKRIVGQRKAGVLSADGGIPVSQPDKCHRLDNDMLLNASEPPVKAGMPDDTLRLVKVSSHHKNLQMKAELQCWRFTMFYFTQLALVVYRK